MKQISVQSFMVGAVFAVAFLFVEPAAWCADSVYFQTNLVSDIPGLAQSTDPNLKNPWGNAFSATSPFWVANAGSNTSTLYQGTGSTVNARVVGVAGGPTGIIANSTTDFVEANGRPASFIFSTLLGSIYAWNATDVNAQNAATVSASFTGLAFANNGSGNFLYATNILGAGGIKVFNSSFAPVTPSGSFVDPNIPTGYVPFNIQTINGQLYVEYANLKTGGGGAVAIFDANGNFVKELVKAAEPHLNEPWGVVIAPANFGSFSNDLLVGNFGDGKINAYDPTTGAFLGTLSDFNGPIVNSGLWSLTIRTGGTFDTSAVYITAGTNVVGLNGTSNGLLAKLNAVTPSTLAIMTASQLPKGKLSSSYAQTLAATGGSSPYSNWKITNGSLPPGLSLSPATGVISGTPNGIGGTFYFTIAFSDSTGAVGSGSFQLTIQQASTPATSNRIGSFAQVASGGGWKTTMTLINLGANTANAQVNFYADDGSPLTLPLTFPQSGSSTSASTVPVTVEPNDSIVIQTNASTPLVSVGWADVQGSGALSGYTIFAVSSPGVPELDATGPLDTRLSSSLLLPYDNTNGYQTAVALANQSSSPQGIAATLLDQNGGRIATSLITLPAFGHVGFFLSSQFANSANQLGILQLQSAGGVTGIGLRFSPTGSFTSIPIIR